MRLLVQIWDKCQADMPHAEQIAGHVLGKQTRARVHDTITRAFAPRFVCGNPPQAWKIVRALEDRRASVEVIRPVYYWITARCERLLHDFVTEELFVAQHATGAVIGTEQVSAWISKRLTSSGQRWTDTVTHKVARGLLATLRDFGILKGASKKHVASIYLPTTSFAYLAFALSQQGVSGRKLVQHPDWGLFLLGATSVERYFMDAHQMHLLEYQAAGSLVRISFPSSTIEEYADVIASRPH
jgi:hypothetical protein